MLRRFFRWIVRTVLVAVVLLAIVAISDYISHRVQPNSVLSVELDGTGGRARHQQRARTAQQK